MNAAFQALVAKDIPVLFGDFGTTVRANGRSVTGLFTQRELVEQDGSGMAVQVTRTVLQVPAGTLGTLPMGSFVTAGGVRYEIRSPLASAGSIDARIDEWQVAIR